MKNFGPRVQVSSRPERELPERQIFWGSEGGGSMRFPQNEQEIFERKYAMHPAPLTEFGFAVAAALDRVWIIDQYLFIPEGAKGAQTDDRVRNRVEAILDWFPVSIEAIDIRFLTKPHNEVTPEIIGELRLREDRINSYSARRSQKCRIDVRYHLTTKFDHIHDRFAIIDNELWHFGGTAGGFLASVSASSRGWNASDHGAIAFFEMAWRAGDKQ